MCSSDLHIGEKARETKFRVYESFIDLEKAYDREGSFMAGFENV